MATSGDVTLNSTLGYRPPGTQFTCVLSNFTLIHFLIEYFPSLTFTQYKNGQYHFISFPYFDLGCHDADAEFDQVLHVVIVRFYVIFFGHFFVKTKWQLKGLTSNRG